MISGKENCCLVFQMYFFVVVAAIEETRQTSLQPILGRYVALSFCAPVSTSNIVQKNDNPSPALGSTGRT